MHKDRFFCTINANLYYGNGYPQYLYSKNCNESIPFFGDVKKYIFQDRMNLKGRHLQPDIERRHIYWPSSLYDKDYICNLCQPLFYKFAKLCDNRISDDFVANPVDKGMKRLVMET